MRMIDADKLYPDCMTKNGTLAISQSQIANVPTVDTTFKEVVAYECGQKSVERPQGKWIEHYDSSDGFTWLTCSRCMCKAYEDDYNFCPNCGADMRKETENE